LEALNDKACVTFINVWLLKIKKEKKHSSGKDSIMIQFHFDQIKKLYDNFWFRCIFFVAIGIVLFFIIRINKWPDYLYSIPISLFSIVGYSIIEAGEFQKFLRNTMIGIIQDSKYLKGLNSKKLDDMLNSLHQVYFELPVRMEPDNLYQFVKENILNKYKGKAYTERLRVIWEFHNIPSQDCYKITITDQSEIKTLKDKEINDTLKIGLNVSRIPGKTMEEHFPLDEIYIKTAYGESKEWKTEILSKDMIKDYKFLYTLPFTVSKNSPVQVKAKKVGYEEARDRTAHQIFSLPTHGFELVIIVHDFEDVKFNAKFAGIPPSEPDRSEQISPTRFEMEYSGWVIPGNSVTVTF